MSFRALLLLPALLWPHASAEVRTYRAWTSADDTFRG